MKGLVRCCALIVVVSITPIGSGWAGSITYTVNYNNELPIPPIPQFDSALGQLLNVEVSVVGSDTGLYLATPTVTSATYYLAVDVDLIIPSNGFSVVTLPVGGSTTRTPYSGGDPGFLTVTGGYSVGVDLTSHLEPFYGTGQIGLSLLEFAALIDLSPSDAYASAIRGYDSGTETITYNFIAPEPPGFIMAGTAALVGLACWLRRRIPVRPTQT
jgi:hypothetical protein